MLTGDKKRVCIIGAGPSGLSTAVAMLDHGLAPVILEQSSEIGGTWRYEVVSNSSHSSAYLNLTANTHKKLMEFKSFPMPLSYPDYPTRKQVFHYLKCYAKKNGLCAYTRFNSRVLNTYPLADGRWTVIYQNGEEILSEIFDALAVCNGHFWDPIIPAIPGSETFTGLQLHSREYREPSLFQGKRVIVNGLGASGADISRELSCVAAKLVRASSRAHPNLKNCRPPITRIDGSTVYFTDGSTFVADAIIHCTGYKITFPFLDPSLLPVYSSPAYHLQLYRHVFPPRLRNLAFIGFVSTDGSVHPVAELQAEWFASVLAGTAELPSAEDMESEIRQWRELLDEYSINYRPMEIISASYRDELSRLIGQNSPRNFDVTSSNVSAA
jgi:lysine/ornithine N-monooxygenase